MAALPQHTRVIISGNSRTASCMQGHFGIVCSPADTYHGGWHTVELERTGQIIKIQRNALTVVEFPHITDIHTHTISSMDTCAVDDAYGTEDHLSTQSVQKRKAMCEYVSYKKLRRTIRTPCRSHFE